MAMHGEHMEAQPPMRLKGDSDDGGVRSYQATRDAQGEAVYACDGRMKCAQGCMEVQGLVKVFGSSISPPVALPLPIPESGQERRA